MSGMPVYLIFMPEQFHEPAVQVLINEVCVPLIEHRGQRVAACVELGRMMRWPGGAVLRSFDENRDAFVLDKDLFKICGEAEHSVIGLAEYRGVTPVFTDSGFKKLAAFVGGLDSPLYDEVFWTYYRTRNPPVAPQPAAVQLALPTVQILDTELPKLTWDGQPVVTLAMIDHVHKRVPGTAARVCRENRERLENGVHYWKIPPDEIRRVAPGVIGSNVNVDVILLSERGYLRLAKSLTDDRAWQVQDLLIAGYFRARALEGARPVAPALPNFEDPIAAAEAWIEQAKGRRDAERALAAESQAKAELAAKVEVLEPKAEVHDQIADADGTRSISEAAKVLGTGEKRLFAQLRELNILQPNNLPYQHHLDSGHFRVVARTYQHGDNRKAYSKTVVTGKGLTYLARRLGEFGR